MYYQVCTFPATNRSVCKLDFCTSWKQQVTEVNAQLRVEE